MPPTKGISCLSLVLYGIRIGSEGLDLLTLNITALHYTALVMRQSARNILVIWKNYYYRGSNFKM